MKKYYETPSVEKISFRYRDQVVAASNGVSGNDNDNSGNSNQTSNGNALNCFVDRILEGAAWNSCDTIGDIIGGIFG